MRIYKIASKEHAEYDIRQDKFRYCPVCGEFYENQCRCSGPHSLQDLKKGHGFKCKNGHRWSGDIVYNPRDEEAEKNLRQERNQTPMAEEIRKNLRIH